MQYVLLILYVIVSIAFVYVKNNYIEAAYYMVENSVMYSIFMPASVILPLGLLFGKYIYDCKLNRKKIACLVLNIIAFIVYIWAYIFWGLKHPECIYYILFLAAEELAVVIFTFVKRIKECN